MIKGPSESGYAPVPAWRLFCSIGVGLLQACGVPGAVGDEAPNRAEDITPLEVGTMAPEFSVRRVNGSELRYVPGERGRPSLIVFYRGGWCPYCNAHLAELRHAEEWLIEMGYEMLFLSADRPQQLYSSLETEDIEFTLLSDSTMSAARAFGIAYRLSDEQVLSLSAHGHDIEEASGESHHMLPVPSVFLVGVEGYIRFAHSNPDYKVRLSAAELLAAAGAQ